MNLDPAEQELESALAGLSPAPTAIDRDRLMFEAGKREGMRLVQRRITGWRAGAGALAAALLVSVSLHSMQWLEQPETASKPALTTMPQAPDAPTTQPEFGALALDASAGFSPERSMPAASYGSMQRRWQAGDEAWLDERAPVRGVNPRTRDVGPLRPRANDGDRL